VNDRLQVGLGEEAVGSNLHGGCLFFGARARAFLGLWRGHALFEVLRWSTLPHRHSEKEERQSSVGIDTLLLITYF